jgi:hypothetical protein
MKRDARSYCSSSWDVVPWLSVLLLARPVGRHCGWRAQQPPKLSLSHWIAAPAVAVSSDSESKAAVDGALYHIRSVDTTTCARAIVPGAWVRFTQVLVYSTCCAM